MMRGGVLLSLVLLAGGCAQIRSWTGGHREATAETLYRQAVMHLDSTSGRVSLDSASYYLDRYLVSSERIEHRTEAVVLRRLVQHSQQLAKVESTLGTQRADSGATPGRGEPTRRADTEPRRDDDAAREIQRLKDELAKANAELERIRKRLANPKEP